MNNFICFNPLSTFAGAVTISWNADDSPGYQIQQFPSANNQWFFLPTGSYTLTCGGRIATICPPGTTSATISGFTATGTPYFRVGPHNGFRAASLNDVTDWFSATLTITDPVPEFASSTVADMVLLKDQTMTPVTLPIAVGGNGRLDYTITPTLPTGLSFNAATRIISGEPTATSTATTYTYTVTDSDATGPDTDTITFQIEVVDTGISVTGLRSPVYKGESIAFTVKVTNVPTIGDYDLDVTAYGAANTTSSSTNSDIGFNSTCSDVAESDDVTASAATQSESHTLHVCDSQYNGGGIITMALVDDDDNVLTGDWFYAGEADNREHHR